MPLKSFLRQCFRRRCSIVLNIVLILVCLVVYLSKNSKIKSLELSLSSPVISNRTSCTPIVFDQTRLNCTGDPAKKWCENQSNRCSNALITFNGLFAITHSAVINREMVKGKRLGGEQIQDVLNQFENDEYFQYQSGFLQIPCKESILDFKLEQDHLHLIFQSLKTYESCPSIPVIEETTIAVNRYDYANIYHTLTDLYTVYLLSRFVRRDPKTVRILILDAHPKGSLDRFWSMLFHSYTRLGHLNQSKLFFNELIWSPAQRHSEIDILQRRRHTPSFFNDFRQYVLEQFQLNSSIDRPLNCDKVKVFFLLRRNYVAHPRNPTGKITRQLSNEMKIIEFLQTQLANYSNVQFKFGYFEQISIEEQLTTINNADIFLGVHGAGLTQAMFQPNRRVLIELVTSGWASQIHFELISSISNINYRRCSLSENSSENAQIIFNCLREKILNLCPTTIQTTKTAR